MGTLIINNVDLDLLDRQRRTLEDMCSNMIEAGILNNEEEDALDGILEMLHTWSDKQYFAKLKEERHGNIQGN